MLIVSGTRQNIILIVAGSRSARCENQVFKVFGKRVIGSNDGVDALACRLHGDIAQTKYICIVTQATAQCIAARTEGSIQPIAAGIAECG